MNVLSWLNPLNSIVSAAERSFERYQTAQTDEKRIAAEREMSFWKGRVEAASVAAKHDRWWSPRSLMGFCVALYVFKLIVWDTILGLGVTPNPGDQVTSIVMTVVGFYFVSKSAETISSTIATAIANRRNR